MKKAVLIIIAFLFLGNIVSAQVISDFEKPGDLGVFVDKLWGDLIDSVKQAPDPTGKSTGVMKLHFNLKGIQSHNAIGLPEASKVQINGAAVQVLTYWVFIPKDSGIPDSIQFGLWFQSSSDWSWNEVMYFAKDIPKGKWYPLSYFMADSSIKSPATDDIFTHNIGDFGIQWWSVGPAATTTWSGNIYIDNVSFIGTKPTNLATFNSGTENHIELWNNGWQDSIKWNPGPIGDSTGILEIKLLNGAGQTGGLAAGVEPQGGFDAKSYNMLAFWVYINSSFPDSAYIQIFAQDNNTWSWPGPKGITTSYGVDIPKNKWFPLYFDLSQATAADTVSGSTFNHATYPLGKWGIQVGGGGNWQGSVYVDKVQFLNAVVDVPEVTISWVAANFQTGSNGLQGFYVPSFADGSLAKTIDVITTNKTWVLIGSADFSKSNHKFALMRDSIPLLDENNSAKWASAATFDIYIPANMPLGGLVQFVITGDATGNAWTQFNYGIDNFHLKQGSWNTIRMNIDSLVNAGVVDPTKRAQIAVQVFYPSPNDTVKWKGNMFFDNLTFLGIERTTQLPNVVTSVEDENIVKEFRLYNNYPNPFNPSTTIKYDILYETKVEVKVYDILGKEIIALVNEKQPQGRYSINFNASSLASGLYIYRIKAGSFVRSNKMMLLK